MGIGITEEHEALRQSVRRWVEAHAPPAAPRAALDSGGALPEMWGSLVAQGWVGLAASTARGGEGFGLEELVVVVEELGRACAPGPFLSTVHATLLLDASASQAADDLVPELIAGRRVATVAMTSLLEGRPIAAGDDGPLEITGEAWPVLSLGQADVVVLGVRVLDGDGDGDGGRPRLCWVVVDSADVQIGGMETVDSTRPVGRVKAERLTVGPERIVAITGERHSERLAAVLFAAEAVGIAQWCVETASSYAKVREQFGRPIGQFQAVKHRCADMLLRTELARAAVWDAARGADDPAEASLTAAAAAGLSVDAAFADAKDCIQVLGGIGFTWEHDAHLYLKRAMAIRSLLCGSGPWYDQAAGLALGGTRRQLAVALPPGAEEVRADAARFAAEVKAVDDRAERRRRIADAGYLMPHWPAPWGRDASALEQVVIDEAFREAGVRRPHLQVGAWVLPTLIAHGTRAQQERWIPSTLHGEITWCQLFSEPGAGSDLASLTTKAVRSDGGWLLSGQKVWTTLAHEADWGICLARTNPDAPKHQGITCFLVDMASEGIDIRPLRELTGAEMFNEVFLSDVFVPDDAVVGAVDDGWRVGRTTLANERVSMGSGSSFGLGLEGLLQLVADTGAVEDSHTRHVVGRLVAEEQGLATLGLRMTLRALTGADPGPESSVRKLLGVEHDQEVQEVGLDLLAAAGATTEGPAAVWTTGFLANRCLTIAGGTSEVQRNVIAERLLGLPRDP